MVDRTPKVRKTPLEERNKTMLGLIGLTMIAVIIAGLLIFRVLAPGYREYKAELAQAAALQVGNAVTVAGVPVGEVTSMKLAGDHVEAEFRAKTSVKLGDQSRATVKTLTILGGRYLALHSAGSGSVPNDTFDLAHTEVPYDLQIALNDATSNFEQMNFQDFGKTMSILGNQLKGLPPLIPEVMNNLNDLSSVIGERRAQIGSLLKTTETVTNTLRSQQAAIGSLVNQGNSLIGEFVARRDSFHALIASMTNLVQTLSGVIVDDRPELEETLQSLNQLTGLLAQHDDLLRSTLQSAPVALRGLANASGTGNAADLNVPAGILVDSWMCAISGRAKQFGLLQYFQDCK